LISGLDPGTPSLVVISSASRVAGFAADQPILAAAAIQAGYGRGERMGAAVLHLAAAVADLLAERAGGPLPRVFELGREALDARAALPAIGRLDLDGPAFAGVDRDRLVDAAAPILLALVRAAADLPAPSSRHLPAWLARFLLRVRSALAPERDDAVLLPRHLPTRVWVLTFFAAASVYVFMWSVVHVVADTRRCLGALDDPLHRLIPLGPGWSLVSHDLYVLVILATIAAMFAVAALGDHRPIVRWGMALAVVAVLRSATIWLVPLCQAGVDAGAVRLGQPPWVELGPLRFMWRAFASNDLLFSGHMAECILALRATRSWPRPLRAAMWVFLVLQAYALLATRGHYTVDLLVAVPMAIFADRISLRLVGALARARPARLC
jgi:hypothetical protein